MNANNDQKRYKIYPTARNMKGNTQYQNIFSRIYAIKDL